MYVWAQLYWQSQLEQIHAMVVIFEIFHTKIIETSHKRKSVIEWTNTWLIIIARKITHASCKYNVAQGRISQTHYLSQIDLFLSEDLQDRINFLSSLQMLTIPQQHY